MLNTNLLAGIRVKRNFTNTDTDFTPRWRVRTFIITYTSTVSNAQPELKPIIVDHGAKAENIIIISDNYNFENVNGIKINADLNLCLNGHKLSGLYFAESCYKVIITNSVENMCYLRGSPCNFAANNTSFSILGWGER